MAVGKNIPLMMVHMAKKTTGMVLGKFMPLHRGHELLLRFAAGMCDRLFVVVDWNDRIDGNLRAQWVRETVPQAEVFLLQKPYPQAPEEHPDFWNVWRDGLLSVLPQCPDIVVASETYGFKLAEVLGATFIPCDLKRENITISATDIRKDMPEKWDYLSSAAKRHYLARICVFGPESTGKSTLTQQLADHFKTVWVPEYARTFIETKGDPKADDMLAIAQGQVALENAMVDRAEKYLFCDTDPLATTIWNRWLFGRVDPELETLAREKKYHLYLLTAPDLVWKKDQVRYFPDSGQKFFDDCVATLEKHGRPYGVVTGQGEARLKCALDIIETHKDRFFRI